MDYLSNLQNRTKWKSPNHNFKVGEIVIIKEDNIPPATWPLGKVIETHPVFIEKKLNSKAQQPMKAKAYGAHLENVTLIAKVHEQMPHSPLGEATVYQLLYRLINHQVASMVIKNDGNLTLSPTFIYVSITMLSQERDEAPFWSRPWARAQVAHTLRHSWVIKCPTMQKFSRIPPFEKKKTLNTCHKGRKL
ncbi:hypothetical protein TNCV_5030141 [Trichonephila clavipes]|nr:hypothetical protein TNCV_5030141 [Trichonephila clavipes]